MTVKKTIEEKLQQAFKPSFLTVENESFRHNVSEGSESHFKVTLASEAFSSMRPVARHQSVYAILTHELSSGVHALALHLYTPEEWESVQQAPASPQCLGGDRQQSRR